MSAIASRASLQQPLPWTFPGGGGHPAGMGASVATSGGGLQHGFLADPSRHHHHRSSSARLHRRRSSVGTSMIDPSAVADLPSATQDVAGGSADVANASESARWAAAVPLRSASSRRYSVKPIVVHVVHQEPLEPVPYARAPRSNPDAVGQRSAADFTMGSPGSSLDPTCTPRYISTWTSKGQKGSSPPPTGRTGGAAAAAGRNQQGSFAAPSPPSHGRSTDVSPQRTRDNNKPTSPRSYRRSDSVVSDYSVASYSAERRH